MRVSRNYRKRSGKILVLIGLSLTLLLGMAALAVDLGVIQMTRTQLQASSDSGSLAGGTELLPGLGASAYRTPTEVQANAEPQAVAYVAKHPAGNAASTHITPDRDVQLGQGYLDQATGVWSFSWGTAPYNAVGVTTQRSEVGSTDGDGPLPLIFAPILGHSFADITVDSAAVILPASGIRIPPGSGINSGLSPFAFWLERWDKYWRARDYFEGDNPTGQPMTASDLDEANNGHEIMDPADLDENGQPRPLFYEMIETGNSGSFEPRQLYDDRFGIVDPELDTPENIVEQEDGVLEMNIYPINSTDGNFGTVDIGGLDNSTSDLGRQIVEGLSETDLENFANNTFDPDPDAPVQLQGDTGISGGLEHALRQVIGQCKAIVLYSVVDNPGNNATYTIVDIVGARFMHADLSGIDKLLVIQPCSVSDPAGIPDYYETIGEETSFFTPLILAK